MVETLARRSRLRAADIIGRLLRRDDGAATLEFVLWLPVFVLMSTAVVDVSLQLAHRSNVVRATQDTAYALSRHQISLAEAETYLRELIYVGNPESVDVVATLGRSATVYAVRSTDSSFVFSLFNWVITYLPDGYLAKASMLAEPV